MEVIEVKPVDSKVTLDHFSAVADIAIRRPHVIKTRMKLVAGAKLIHHQPFDLKDEISAEDFACKIRREFKEGNLDLTEEDYSQQEFDYSQDMKIIRRIIYKNCESKESTEYVLWNVISESRACLHVIPLDSSENDVGFSNSKSHYCVDFDSKLQQVCISNRTPFKMLSKHLL